MGSIPQACGRRMVVPDAFGGGTIDSLLERMRAGDRVAAADFMDRYGSRVRARVRHKLSPGMRRVFDSQDVLSTVARRLDQVVRRGGVEASSEEQLWALVFTIANNSVSEKGRIQKRLRKTESEDSPFANEVLRRMEEAERVEAEGAVLALERVFELIDDATERQIMTLWLNDVPLVEIAACLDIPEGTIRWRWAKLRDRLREKLGPEVDRA